MLDVEVGDPFEPLADLGHDLHHRQAALGVAAVPLDVLLHQQFQGGEAAGGDRPAVEEQATEVARLVGDPGVEGGHQRVAVDEAVLQGQQAEQHVLGGRGGRIGVIAAIEAEPGGDRGPVVGEPREVLVGGRVLAGAAAQFNLDLQQFLDQAGPVVGPGLGRERFDPGPLGPFLPLLLEAVGRLVDPGALAGRDGRHRRCPC
ncbi:MAG: hypothetical protein U0800_18610 [Isosphaeraceae bacterium]